MDDHTHTDVLIVGAGMAGLMAAHSLAQQHVHVLVVEKNKRVGGRLATAAINGGLADTGAQFITVRNPQFRTFMERWLDEGLVFEWAQGWSDGSLTSARRLTAIRGMPCAAGWSNLAESLAAGWISAWIRRSPPSP